jgi:hypothetical protein
LWSTGILIVLGTLAFGLPAVDAALPAGRPVPAGQPYPLGNGVTVVPPAGAELDVTTSAAVPGRTVFLLGGVRYLIAVAPFVGSLAEATDQLRRKVTANRGYQVTGPETVTRTAQGVPGRQGGYTSPGRDGRYAVFLAAGVSVQITLAGTEPQLHPLLPALTASVASLTFPSP